MTHKSCKGCNYRVDRFVLVCERVVEYGNLVCPCYECLVKLMCKIPCDERVKWWNEVAIPFFDTIKGPRIRTAIVSGIDYEKIREQEFCSKKE